MMQRNIVVIKVNKIEDLLKISLKSRRYSGDIYLFSGPRFFNFMNR